MAGEAILKLKTDNPIDFTCADGTGIEKGTLLAMTSPRTAIAASAANQMLAGICAREKIASDGRTQIAVFRRGVFDMYVSGGLITVGDQVASAAGSGFTNYVISGSILTSGSAVLGTALETGTTGNLIEVAVDIGTGRANR